MPAPCGVPAPGLRPASPRAAWSDGICKARSSSRAGGPDVRGPCTVPCFLGSTSTHCRWSPPASASPARSVSLSSGGNPPPHAGGGPFPLPIRMRHAPWGFPRRMPVLSSILCQERDLGDLTEVGRWSLIRQAPRHVSGGRRRFLAVLHPGRRWILLYIRYLPPRSVPGWPSLSFSTLCRRRGPKGECLPP
jgi:hypothetical protein